MSFIRPNFPIFLLCRTFDGTGSRRTKSSGAPGRSHHRFPSGLGDRAAQRGYAACCWRVKVERCNVLRCAYITDTRSLGAEGAPAAENYNLNGHRPFPHARLISLFSSKHLIFMRHSNSTSLLFERGPRSRDTTRRCHFAKLFLLPPPFPRRCIRERVTNKKKKKKKSPFQWRNWKKVVSFLSFFFLC